MGHPAGRGEGGAPVGARREGRPGAESLFSTGIQESGKPRRILYIDGMEAGCVRRGPGGSSDPLYLSRPEVDQAKPFAAALARVRACESEARTAMRRRDRVGRARTVWAELVSMMLGGPGLGRRRSAAPPTTRPRPASGVRSHCHFVLASIQFIPDSLRDSVPLFLKRQCDEPYLRGGVRGA